MKNSLTNYREFTVQQFLEDSYFQEWVLRPDVDSEQFWGNWLSQNSDKSEEIEESRNLLLELKNTEYSLSPEEIENLWKSINQRGKPKKKTLMISSRNWPSWTRFAVAGIVSAIVFGIWWNWIKLDNQEIKTAFGETLHFSLPDGSKVVLNANSKVTFSEGWKDKNPREIWLEGEAFFDVVHLESHQPFLVYTNNGVEIEVLGTSFSVYGRDEKSQIVLEEGNVSLSLSDKNQPREKILMKPGDLVSIMDNKVEKKQVIAENYTSWTYNLLILDETSLEEIIRVGRENFGLQIEIDPKVSLTQTASGSMPLEDPTDFMNLTSKIFNISIEKKDNKYLLTP